MNARKKERGRRSDVWIVSRTKGVNNLALTGQMTIILLNYLQLMAYFFLLAMIGTKTVSKLKKIYFDKRLYLSFDKINLSIM